MILQKLFGKKNNQQNNMKKYNAVTFPDINNFQVTEAYNSLRVNIMFSLPKETCRKILVSSANPSEGKTTTCVNTAIAIAMTEAKVLLIDCDFRRPRVHKYFNASNRVGMSNFLSGMCTLKECLVKTQYPNLDVITTGLIPPNPSELLGCDNMKKVIAYFEEVYDYIILDTPPINVVSDALALTPIIDGVMIVIRQGETTHPDLKKAVSIFEYAKTNVIGIVMNSMYEKKRSYKNKYYKKYNYEYGYSDNDITRKK